MSYVDYKKDEYSAIVTHVKADVKEPIKIYVTSTGMYTCYMGILYKGNMMDHHEFIENTSIDIPIPDMLSVEQNLFFNLKNIYRGILHEIASLDGVTLDDYDVEHVISIANGVSQCGYGYPKEDRDVYGGDHVVIIAPNYVHHVQHMCNYYTEGPPEEDMSKDGEKVDASNMFNYIGVCQKHKTKLHLFRCTYCYVHRSFFLFIDAYGFPVYIASALDETEFV